MDDVRSKCGARVCRANIELLTIQESYAVRNPRDYKKNPPQEALTLLTDYRKRYKAQLPSTRGTRPDPQAPIDKTTHAPKRYFRLDNFIRSMVYQFLKAEQNTRQPTD